MSVLIIGQADCSLTRSAIEFSEINNIKHSYKQIPDNITKEKAQNKAGSLFKDLPAIFVNDVYIGSLKEYLNLSNKRK